MMNPFNDYHYISRRKGFVILIPVYSNGTTFIIQIDRDLYYYGDGVKVNAFGQNAVQFLRYNPHLEDVAGKRLAIPEGITKAIKDHLKAMEE